MTRLACLALLLAVTAAFTPTPVTPSGSIGTGPGQISPRKAYAQGKALTFKVLVCDDCPLQKNELDRDRALSLTASLAAVYEGEETGSPDDKAVQELCGPEIEDCGIRMEVVHYFLTRRFKLESAG
ncbi:MAG: hypothetical protein OXH51_08055 [Gemmatimonadetes bacterium]|nr:hypothetical protein [Gemmatimonadota bacterium]MCY3611472.1 hypothetical protein [Gemmatimonadota bacterium]MCY3679140.1 hypothetical protein [Gemmatimonadota bacterium]MYA40726.1 hypothetical protein [Gemmatimonadota bacterium]MYE93497.1 hypothetical protein [Gemmatimonadota bacterium]